VQIEAGVDAIQIFDSWAHHLAYNEFKRFTLPYLKQVIDFVKMRQRPVIVFSKAASLFAEDLASLNPSAISVDWNGDLAQIRRRVPTHIALQGNLDPAVLYGSKEVIQQATDRILHAMAGNPGYIFNLGHGVLPDTPYENVKYLVDYVKCHSLLPL
jgi:uroporphyrinogen decarboxylase